MNLDETCIIANDGNIKVLVDKYNVITSKIVDYCKLSITIVRVGNAVISNGPMIFIVKGNNIWSNILKDIVNF